MIEELNYIEENIDPKILQPGGDEADYFLLPEIPGISYSLFRRQENPAENIFNPILCIYIQGKQQLGFLELIKTEISAEYTCHYRTSGFGHEKEYFGESFGEDEREILFQALLKNIPQEGVLVPPKYIDESEVGMFSREIPKGYKLSGNREVLDYLDNPVNLPKWKRIGD